MAFSNGIDKTVAKIHTPIDTKMTLTEAFEDRRCWATLARVKTLNLIFHHECSFSSN